jgi:MFS family permease
VRLRNVPILSIGQALGMSGAPILVLVGGIIGIELAPSPSWATLPISLMIVGGAVFTVPAALLMQRVGRRRGFVLAAVIAGLAALLAAYAVAEGSFILFCAATVMIGVNSAFVRQYRFAAAESVAPRYAGRAVALVLLGGILAGVLGPEIVKRTQSWLEVQYSGSFLSLVGVYAVVALLMLFLRDVTPDEQSVSGPERPLREIVAQPAYLVAVLAGAVSFGVMSFIMTATPIELHQGQGFSLDRTAWVIQGHIVAMYLPSLFTGFILERLGVLRVMTVGVLCLVSCTLLGLVSQELVQYWGALVLLGVGWNLLYVGGTVLLTRSYAPSERFKAQATNDFIVFGVQALSSLSVGTVLFYADWDMLNLISLAVLLLTFVAILLAHRQVVPTPQVAVGD